MLSHEERRAAAAFWARAQNAVYRRQISPGAFAMLHQLAAALREYGEPGGALTLGERALERATGTTRKTIRKRRHELTAAGLISMETSRQIGFCKHVTVRLLFCSGTGVKNTQATGVNGTQATGVKKAHGTGVKNTQAHYIVPSSEGETHQRCSRTTEETITAAEPPNYRPAFGGMLEGGMPSATGFIDPPSAAGGNGLAGNDDEGPGAPTRPAPHHAETQMMGRLRQLLGETTMANYGGKWRKRVRENYGKAMRCIAELENRIREGKRHSNPGGYLDWLWKNFSE